MPRAPGDYLNPREQQIMEFLFQNGTATAADLEDALPGNPSNSTVRTLLRIMEKRGHVSHIVEDGRFIYRPARPHVSEAIAALNNVIKTFFEGSVEQAFTTLLSRNDLKLPPEEMDRLSEMIQTSKRNEADQKDRG